MPTRPIVPTFPDVAFACCKRQCSCGLSSKDMPMSLSRSCVFKPLVQRDVDRDKRAYGLLVEVDRARRVPSTSPTQEPVIIEAATAKNINTLLFLYRVPRRACRKSPGRAQVVPDCLWVFSMEVKHKRLTSAVMGVFGASISTAGYFSSLPSPSATCSPSCIVD